MMALRHPNTGGADRFLIVPCEPPGCEDLTIIWDRQEEQVIDVMSRAEVEAYVLNDGGL